MNNLLDCEAFKHTGVCRHSHCPKHHPLPIPNSCCIVLIRNCFDIRSNAAEFKCYWERVYRTVKEVGEITEIAVAMNTGSHLRGNIYVKFTDPSKASEAVALLNGVPLRNTNNILNTVLTSMEDFKTGSCNEYPSCNNGAKCDLMHLKFPDRLSKKTTYGKRMQRKKGKNSRNQKRAPQVEE